MRVIIKRDWTTLKIVVWHATHGQSPVDVFVAVIKDRKICDKWVAKFSGVADFMDKWGMTPPKIFKDDDRFKGAKKFMDSPDKFTVKDTVRVHKTKTKKKGATTTVIDVVTLTDRTIKVTDWAVCKFAKTTIKSVGKKDFDKIIKRI